ncbi:hypothetical protein [Stutzerimonas kunmingensis]|uniref:hypothetical protein n=1 Tax=Stutzerimonas kunmingensis TaxID=1211807 RepID=UPI002FC79DEC
MANKTPRPVKRWGYYNLGSRLIGVAYTRAQARLDACHWAGRPWSEVKEYVQLRKVIVTVAPGASHAD